MDGNKQGEVRYRRLRKLGEGGSGRVWLVDDLLRDHPVALKEVARLDGPATETLRDEFVLLASLRHPNLVEVLAFHDRDEEFGQCFTLEFIEGDDLVTTVRREGVASLPGLFAESLRALAFLHDFGLIHRDLKPANLLVRERAEEGHRVVVLDFGLALQGSSEPQSRRVVGTLPYIAPEVLAGEAPTRRSDLYSLGVVLFESVFGRLPRDFDPAAPERYVLDAISGEIEMPAVPAGLPDSLGTLLSSLLDRRPEHRPATAAEALARLNDAFGTRLVLETPATRASRIESGRPPGRAAELETLETLLAPGAPQRLIWIDAGAGCGKTRVLEWIAGEAVRQGREVSHRLEALTSSSELPGDVPRLVLLDEIESAPESLIAALDRHAREPNRPSGIVLAAVRGEEVRGTLLRALIHDAGFVPTIGRVTLAPFDEQGVREVARRALGRHEISASKIRRLLEATEGNPLLLRDALAFDGDEQPRAGAGVAASLVESIDRRLQELDERETIWLRALVVLRGGGDDETLRRLVGADREATRAAATRALRSGLVRRSRGGWVPASRLIETRVRERTGRDDLRGLSRLAGELLAEADAPPERLAPLWQDAGESERAIESGLLAAARAEADANVVGAIEWLAFVLAQLPRRDPRRAALRLRHAEQLKRAERYRAAARAYAAVARWHEDPETRIDGRIFQAHALLRAGILSLGERIARRNLERAEQSEDGGESLARARATSVLAAAISATKSLTEAKALFKDAISRFDRLKAGADKVEALHLLALAHSGAAEFDAARVVWQEAETLARHYRDDRNLGNILVGRATMERRAERFDDALQYAKRAIEFTERHNQRRNLTISRSSLSHLYLRTGKIDLALEMAAETARISRLSGNRLLLMSASSLHCEVLNACGRPAESAQLARAVLEMPVVETENQQELYLTLTLIESILERPAPGAGEVQALLETVMPQADLSPKIAQAALMIELEACARFAWPLERASATWDRLEALRASLSGRPDPEVQIRARRAYADLLHQRSGRLDEALALADEAAVLAEHHDYPALASRSHALRSRILRRLGRTVDADDAWAVGRSHLDEAAGRIEDERVRHDFIQRPIFADLTRPEAATSTGEKRLLAIYEMIRVLNSENDPDLLLESMLDMALQVVRAERGMILLRDGDDYRVNVARNLEKETIRDATEFSRNVVLTAGSGTAVLAVDTDKDERLRELKSVNLFGIRSVLCVPLRSRGEIIGAVYLDSRNSGALFSYDDLRFLEAFGDHAALALENARIRRELELENRRLQVAAESRISFDNLIGRAPAMQQVYDLIGKVAETHLPVLIFGESGTGKELVARAIHRHSLRRRKPFLSENCAAIPETLLESELFGHVRGAFTGAERDRVGLFEQADGGTLFLDEIGDMPHAMQARLLRVLQEGEIRRVGGERVRKVDVRVLAATHRDLARDVEAGRFREDLFYRLQVLVIQLPPLRERPGDVPLLVQHFLERISRERGRTEPPRLRSAVLTLLERYHWPGNVRQLENQLQRMALLAGDGPISLEVVESDDDLKRTLLVERSSADPIFSLERNEKQQIAQALASCDGNRTRAAKMLGISRATIFRKVKQYELS